VSTASTILSIVTKPFFDWMAARTERKKARDSLRAKATMARDEQGAKQELTDSEWEVVMATQMAGTWKDEYALLIGTGPYLMIFGSALWYAFTGDYRMMEGTLAGIQLLDSIGVDIGFIITAVVLGASGLSVWRLMRR
jgi:hypothetical protein